MKIKLKDGIGPITNSNFSIYPGQIIEIEDGIAFDPEVIEVVTVNKETGLETYESKTEKNDITQPEQEEVVVPASFDEIEKKEIVDEEKEDIPKIKFNIKYLSGISGIGRKTAKKILKYVKSNAEFFEKEELLRKEMNDKYINLLKEHLKGE